MKKTIQNITGLASAAVSVLFLLSGCALTMEDWVVTDENKGYGETQKEEYDGLTVQYKYKDNTRSLTDKIQGYLVSFDEEDSILHFMDNLPDEYLPKAGGCVVANCCQQFPGGLVARVQSVDHSNGMYNIALSDADIKDAYDEFEYNLETDIVMSSDTTSSDVKKRKVRRKAADGIDDAEDIITDWTLYNRMVNGTNKMKTRSDDFDSSSENQKTSTKDDYDNDIDGKEIDEDIDWDAITTVSNNIIEINNSTGIQSPLVNTLTQYLTGNLLNDFYIKFNSLTKTRIKKIVSLSQDMEYQKTIQANGYSLKFSIGYDIANRENKDNQENIFTARSLWKLFKKNTPLKTAFKEYAQKEVVPAKSKLGWAFELPLPSLPVAALLKITPKLDYSLGVYGGDSIAYWCGATVVETEMKGGNKIQEDKSRLKTKPDSYHGEFIGGKYTIGGDFEVFVGVGKKVGVRDVVGVGAFATMGVTLSGVYDQNINLNGYSTAITGNGSSLKPTFSVGAKAYAGSFVDFNFLPPYKFPLKSLVDFPYYPIISVDDPVMEFSQNETGYDRTIDFSYKITDLGCYERVAGFMVPKLCVYRAGHYNDEKPIAILADEKLSRLKEGETFKFHYYTTDVITDYDLIPATKDYYETDDDLTIYPDYKLYVPPTLMPKVKYKIDDDGNILYQTFGGRENTASGVNFNYYFTIPFELKNAGMIENYWDDWGILVNVYISKDGTNYTLATDEPKPLSLKGKVVKSGSYQPVVKFTYSIPGKVEAEPYFKVESHLYYVDKDGGQTRTLASSSSNPTASDYLTKDVTFSESYHETHSYCELINSTCKMENHKLKGPSWFENKEDGVTKLPLTVYGVNGN